MVSPAEDSLFVGRCYVSGAAEGRVLSSDLELSFFGGVEPGSGDIIDRHHPLFGQNLSGKILVIPGGRGSCSGSAVMLELLLADTAPSAIIFERNEDILTLGVIVGEELFGKSIPVVILETADFRIVQRSSYARIRNGLVAVGRGELPPTSPSLSEKSTEPQVILTDADTAMLAGANGKAQQVAMRIIVRTAQVQRAERLIEISQAHVDACIYTGPGALAFAEKVRDWGGKFKVPTSLNAISVDYQKWRNQGVDPALGEPAARLADVYTGMGAAPTFTCAPYLTEELPALGSNVAWAESNAVVFANSVLGARTMKYPDFLDVAVALTGRGPLTGPYLTSERKATVHVKLPSLQGADDALFPLAGYSAGILAANRIPVISGFEGVRVTAEDLKAFGAAFATTSSAPMFHMVGITPEAPSAKEAAHGDDIPTIELGLDRLRDDWCELNSAEGNPVDLVSFGNPHFSLNEIRCLATLCRGRTKWHDTVAMVTTSRITLEMAQTEGLVDELRSFGIQFSTDTCWCMITEPIIPLSARTIMTNSAKYAHYGPGLTGRLFFFGSLSSCVEAACQGKHDSVIPDWL